jgi:nitrate reductase alpha subunit
VKVKPLAYSGSGDIWREKWRWDRVVKGTHNRTNCISACSWDLFVKDGIVWREEQNAIYESSRPDVPDFGPRGSGRWKRISWDQALDEIADGLVDATLADGTESIVYDHGTTNIDFGPDFAGELRFAYSLGTTIIDSWAGVGDMPMGAVQTWGMYNCEGTSDDWFRSDYIVVWVGNPAITRMPEVHFMHEARYRGARLVVIAPDYSATAVHADLWVTPRFESDAALALAMAQVIIAEGLYDR